MRSMNDFYSGAVAVMSTNGKLLSNSVGGLGNMSSFFTHQ